MTLDKEQKAMTWFGERGFEHWETGGGCTAFARHLDDGKHYVMLTDTDGASHPVEGDKVLVGIYSEDVSEGLAYAVVDTFEGAIEKANEFVRTYVR